MAHGLATKGAFSRRQCAVGPCGVCKLERLKAAMVPNAKLRGGGQDGPKNWKKTLTMHGFGGLVELQQRQTQPHTHTHTQYQIKNTTLLLELFVIFL